MRIITKYAAVVLVTASTALTSCKKDFLELTNPIALTPQQALGSEADLLVALRGAYSSLRNVDLYGRTVPIIGDVFADNAYQSALNTNRYTAYHNYTTTSIDANALGLWTAGYNSILRANNIINSALASTTNVDQYKGEAYAIRALTYFTLVRYFARPYTDSPAAMGIPIVTSFNPDLKPGRNTVAEVYALILDDLTKAYNLMKTYTNSSQFSKYAARGLQAKVYITMGDKPNALTAALDVINNGGFTPLTTANHASYWANSAVNSSKLETLFEVSSDAVANLSFDALPYLYAQSGNYGDILASDNLISTFNAGDVRLALYPQVTRAGVQVYSVNKYPVFIGDVSDTKVLRLSEMYLIAAEASYPTNETNARGYVNFIRARRNAPDINSTGAQLFEDIIAERRRELAMEGDRYLDLMRLKRDIVRTTPNYPASALNIPFANFRRILPIPQSETDANEIIKAQQNPGY
jgi:hypothetical protein